MAGAARVAERQRSRAGALRRTVPDNVSAIDAVATSDRSDIELLVSTARRRIQIIDV
ncbi:MAG: hypothetical protein ABI706_21260 [Ilumatobacteraceae bacterium]